LIFERASEIGAALRAAPRTSGGQNRIDERAYNHLEVTSPSYRFGPFLADRVRYRVLRGTEALDVTPKLLDLLFHLLDNAGALITKEQLLDTLWPNANVTDNALAQAVSELRDVLGDDAGAPQFIKTVARRGYRFVAPVEIAEPGTTQPIKAATTPTGASDEHALAVLDFTNVTRDEDSGWLCAGIAETVTADLRALDRFRVVDRWHVMEAVRRTDGSLSRVAADLGVRFAVAGSFQRHGDRIRITARVVDVSSGEALVDAKVDGPLNKIFELQDEVVEQFSKELGDSTVHAHPRSRVETHSLEAYRAFTEGWVRLEALDVEEIPKAIADFQTAVAADPRYALAYTGLASAQFARYETTRSDNEPDRQLLDQALAHARHAAELDAALAEAQATLALILVSAWKTEEALVAARRAVAVEPTNWRHAFRLGHASWGEHRLRAAGGTLALYPEFAFAHFQMAMVHVARGHLAEAETVLRQGAAVQDRQIARGERYPALGLHWLLGLVRLAQDDVDEALDEFDRERVFAQPRRLYGREYAMNAVHGRGLCQLHAGRFEAAIESFQQALVFYPDHAQSNLGLALAFRATDSDALAEIALDNVEATLSLLASARPIEAGIVRAELLTARGNADAAVAELGRLLEQAPPGFAGWTLPAEFLLRQLTGTKGFTAVLGRLADRAR
jgi:DNA-binding winged helix-turn-helix (wHTH) protein/Tfp pilus assembly protein PilF